jgi:hypothetical protein
MNPPFGAPSKGSKEAIEISYPDSSNDLLAVFVDRGLSLLRYGGRLGAITSRTCFFLRSFVKWRKKLLIGTQRVDAIADLGQGVMDDAMVEAAAYVLVREKQAPHVTVIRSITEEDRALAMEESVQAFRSGKNDARLFSADPRSFDLLPEPPFVYWVDSDVLEIFNRHENFDSSVGRACQGLSTSDNFRFVRAVWEVGYQDTIFCYYPTDGSDFCSLDDQCVREFLKRRQSGALKWAFHIMAGSSQPWFSPVTVKVQFEHHGKQLANFRDSSGKPKGVLRNPSFYYKPGISWTRRAVRFYPYAIPSNCIPSASRYMAFPDHGKHFEALGVSASRMASAFMRFYAEFWQRPNFLVEGLKALPWPKLNEVTTQYIKDLVKKEVEVRRRAYQNFEPFHVDRALYALRNRIERFINRLKNSRRVATRYDHTATSFLGFAMLTSIRQWINFVHAA